MRHSLPLMDGGAHARNSFNFNLDARYSSFGKRSFIGRGLFLITMADAHMSHDEFFAKLGELFNHRKGSDHGAIYLTQKRLTFGQDIPGPSEEEPSPDTHPAKPLPLVIRATSGQPKKDRASKVKLSTVVQPEDLEAFYVRYADICKGGMTALKPRDRSKKKAKAKKKKAAS
ncbi:signal recognition particle subunit srp14 [Fusarium albosuccineum]|uniref:Signal recognition particle subunit SRP14 n=1 Tax=Fusarium albosuccineum TaxID=1237068 RepID=A0A8H4LCU9_9HYPO|nr:signal recognition particle subunit srp14 [Fusarium albosuccineum]